MKTVFALTLGGIATLASAQASVNVTTTIDDVDGLVDPGQQVLVTVTAEFSGAFAFAGYWFDLSATGTGAGVASDAAFLNGLGGLAPAPTANGGGYDDIQSANFPPSLGGNASNPIGLFQYVFTAQTPGTVVIGSAVNPASIFDGAAVYLIQQSFAATGAPTTNAPVTFVITPAPASAALVGLGGLALARRRR